MIVCGCCLLGSITIMNSVAAEPQYLDLTGMLGGVLGDLQVIATCHTLSGCSAALALAFCCMALQSTAVDGFNTAAAGAAAVGLGPKNQTQYNIKLPSTKTNGAVLNIIADDMLANVSSEELSADPQTY
jgi:hypothetical protein